MFVYETSWGSILVCSSAKPTSSTTYIQRDRERERERERKRERENEKAKVSLYNPYVYIMQTERQTVLQTLEQALDDVSVGWHYALGTTE